MKFINKHGFSFSMFSPNLGRSKRGDLFFKVSKIMKIMVVYLDVSNALHVCNGISCILRLQGKNGPISAFPPTVHLKINLDVGIYYSIKNKQTPCSFFCVETGTCRLLLVHIMTLKVPMSTRHPCPLLKMWQLVKGSPFLQIHHSQRPGEYKTQVWTMSLRSHVCIYSISSLFESFESHRKWECDLTALIFVYYRCRVVATWG